MQVFEDANAVLLSHPDLVQRLRYWAGADGVPGQGAAVELSGGIGRDPEVVESAFGGVAQASTGVTLHLLVAALAAEGVAAPQQGDLVEILDGPGAGQTWAVAWMPPAPEYGAWALPLQEIGA